MRILEEYSIVIRNADVKYKYYYRLLYSMYKKSSAYGIEIERKDYKGVIQVNDEKDFVKLVSTKKDSVKRIINKLYHNEVSPIHLVDIVGEFVDNHIYEFDAGITQA